MSPRLQNSAENAPTRIGEVRAQPTVPEAQAAGFEGSECVAMSVRERFRVVISAGLWRGFEVSVEPPSSSHGLRGFRDHPAALAHAEALERLEGWPIIDRTREGRA